MTARVYGRDATARALPNGLVLVYCDAGASVRSVQSAIHSMKRHTKNLQVLLMLQRFIRTLLDTHRASLLTPDSCKQVLKVTAAELCHPGWISSTAVLLMPGGADLPYCRALDGRGNQMIRGASNLRPDRPCHINAVHLP